MVVLDESWPAIERFLNWWLVYNKSNVSDEAETKQFFVEMWDLWQTAVFAETALTVSAELIVDWWRWFAQGVMPEGSNSTTSDRFRTLTPTRMLSLSQWCVVQQPEAFAWEKVEAFWQNLIQMGLIPSAAAHQEVALLLTLFGQLILRRRWADAMNTLWLTLRRTARFPRAVIHWWRFGKTAVSYLIQSKFMRETYADAAHDKETHFSK